MWVQYSNQSPSGPSPTMHTLRPVDIGRAIAAKLMFVTSLSETGLRRNICFFTSGSSSDDAA